MAAPKADLAKDGALDIGHAVKRPFFRQIGDQRIKAVVLQMSRVFNKNGEHLHQPLFGRMGNIGGGGGIGRAAHTGFVGKKPAFDAVSHAAACETAHNGLHIKGSGDDHGGHLRQRRDIFKDNPQSQRHIA